MDGQPTIAWPEHVQDQNGTLYFQDVQITDKGLYTCVAKNAEGFINTTIYVDVVGMFRNGFVFVYRKNSVNFSICICINVYFSFT